MALFEVLLQIYGGEAQDTKLNSLCSLSSSSALVNPSKHSLSVYAILTGLYLPYWESQANMHCYFTCGNNSPFFFPKRGTTHLTN